MARRARLVPYSLLTVAALVVTAFVVATIFFFTALPADARRQPTHADRSHPPTPHSEVLRALEVASREFGVSHSRMTSVAKCESGLNPFNSNGSHHGLFAQWGKKWADRVRAFNQRNPNNPVSGTVWNAFDNARVSAEMMRLNPSLSDWRACL